MEKYFLFVFVFVAMMSCSKSEYEITKNPEPPYMRMWAMQACFTGFDIKYEESPETWKGRVLDTLKSKNFDIISSHLGFIKQEPFIGCGNCLRTGDYVDVEVRDSQKVELKNLGFSDE